MKDKKEGLLTRIIDSLSPKTAAKRAYYRARQEHFNKMERDEDYRKTVFALLNARGYRAASQSKTKTPWLGGGSTADSNIINDLPTLMERSREINRDDPIGSGITGTFVRNIIGTGMRPQARTDNYDRNKLLEEIFAERKDQLNPADDLTFGEHQQVVFRKIIEDGGVFVKETRSSEGEPVWFEVIEKDRVYTPRSEKAQTENGSIVDGVEKDKYGRPVAYWVADSYTTSKIATPTFKRVTKDNIVHLRIIERPGQTHGVPIFHAILQDLRDLDLLILASLKRVQIAACLAVFLESSESTENILDATAEKYGYMLDQDIEPGMIFKLYPNEKVNTLLPNFPAPELAPFIIMLARRIGAALGITWQMVLKDFSQSNYSSARTDLLEARQVFVKFQTWFIEKLLNWEWFKVLDDARLRGDVRMRGITSADISKVLWIPNGWRWVDPVKEVQASELELKLGISTLRDICASQGKDWEEVLEQRLQEELLEQTKRKEMGLPAKAAPGGEALKNPNKITEEQENFSLLGFRKIGGTNGD